MTNRSYDKSWRLNVTILVATALAGVLVLSQPSTAAEFADSDFTLMVLPLLNGKCLGCHGEDSEDLKGEFDIRSREALLRGGESGEPSIIPGKPDDSPLYQAVMWDGLEMPPKENDRLTEAQTEWIHRWIAAGAPWPSEAEQEKHRLAERAQIETEDGVIVQNSGGLGDEWTYRRYKPADTWAFQPITKPTVPADVANPIDFFIDRKLEDAGIRPAAQADARTLIRRASYDLTGLPPTPERVAQFVKDWESDSEVAWNTLIDELLDSPHYGERWGQHWLDISRYADTGGYSNDYERSNAWRYRDYVIRSFNEDKPYDEFVVEQLAGDELADQSARERLGLISDDAVHQNRLDGNYSEQESEWLVATGFLRMGPWDNAMVQAPEARQIYLDDVVNSVGQTFLATTMRCVKCHDHKFDPIPTKDYYRLYAAFAGTQMAERPAPFLSSENREGFEDGQKFVEKMLSFAVQEKDKIKAKQEAAARKWYRENNREYVPEKDRQNLPDEEKPPRHVGLDYVEEGTLKVREQDEWIWNRRLERYQPMVQSVYNGHDAEYKWNGARKLRINPKRDPDWLPASVIYTGGSLEARGAPVSPGVPSFTPVKLNLVPEKDPWTLPDPLDGRRLALAEWMVHPQNSLTSRAIVNRIWQHHFGEAIARNPNNFGAKGKKPTHPDLLDWLASDLVEGGWTLKRIHRQIMTSRVYRQSSTHPEVDVIKNDDPNNELLAYHPPRRLTAEELRDSFLSITGELNRTVGGIPVMPEINMEVALQPRMIQFSLAPAYQPSATPEQRNRRTIYAYRVRGQADPFLELFNQPNPNDSCELRDSAAVTPQAFTLLNSDFATDRSIAFAERLEAECDDLDQQIRRAFELSLGRQPSPEEFTRMTRYVADMANHHAKADPPKTVYPTEITRSVVEEFSGKPFEYQEILPVFNDYQADKKPSDVSTDTRAVADLCLLLFNSNEFVFVY